MNFPYTSILSKDLSIFRLIFLTAENGRIKGSITGVSAANSADKIWLVFQALGDIAFSYPYTLILLEIQVYIWLLLSSTHETKLHF